MIADGYKETEIGVIPIEWDIETLENISKITMGQSPKSDTYSTDNIGMPLIQGNADCKNRKTQPRTYTTEPTKKCFVGDIIMTVRAPVGAISKSLHNACIGRGVCSIKSKDDNEYIYHCLVNYEDSWDKLSQGSTFTAVSGSDIKNLKFPFPPLKEQEKIADILSTADAKIDAIQIQIDKAETLKKGLLQKLLSEGIGHSEFKDSEIGKIPESWEIQKLSNISGKIVVGYVGNVNDHYCKESEGVPFYRTLNVRNGILKHNNLQYVTKEFNEKNKKSQIYNEDILIARVGANLGMTCKVSGLTKMSNSANVIIIKSSVNMNSDFIVSFLLSENGKKQIFSGSAGGAQGVFNTTLAQSLRVPYPPLQEQKQIAEILSTADEKLEVLRAKKQKYETLKKGLLQKLLSGEVRV